jgi:hypothetical protein
MADLWRWRPPSGPAWPAPSRRALLAASLASLAGRAVAATALPQAAELLVAGPSGGRLDRLADSLMPALARGLPAGIDLRRDRAGGPDGVTGANQFEARGMPDGASLLLMPGDAALAWLTGDSRARFNVGSLVTVLAGATSGVLMSRLPLDPGRPTPHLRIVADRPDGPGLAGLLALDLLGLRPQPAFGYPDPASVEQIILANGADAAFVIGPDAAGRIARLGAAGLAPVFALGVPGDDGAMLRDPALPDVPTLPELVARRRGVPPAGALYDAWRAVAVAAQMSFLLALPALTPAALVSLWREAGIHATPPPDSVAAGSARLLAYPEANQFVAPIASADAPMLIELRRWLATRLRWQPA